ncbi:uncharacterized protein BDW43DRAFT_164208 [Aspergillus alliaceus]|uniref:uncharacterized protein n=1 Tax=Petromyces alliaceus TaxID=209559 RepID=UPI0012A5DB3A|nr:uncharacterized protein BDW43DRAFT_164208 [Aspergillus alliaceus]KAB8230485.1 hypothetical protein BDW43DRAFT_164208 [Aspergillus alliaceus]
MYQPQCHGPYRPATVVRDNSVMRSPYTLDSNFSSNSSSYMSGESGSPRQGVVTPLNKQNSSQLSPISPQQQRQNPPFLPDSGSSRLKRRASQGSLLTKPSPVSRFLSRSNASLHLPSFEHLGLPPKPKPSGRVESRIHSADSRLRLHTTSAASSSLATRAPQSTSTVWNLEAKGDYPTAPPTPPEDDEYVAWNPRSRMLLFESPLNREPGPMPMDEGPNVDGAARGAASDGLSSPSDQLSNVSPSSSGSPGSSGDMDCDLNSWLGSGIEAAVSSLPFSYNRGEAVKIVSQMLPYPCTANKNAAVPTNDDVFSSLIQAVQRRVHNGQSPYINITHAVPEQFSLSNLPYSPPNTPRSLFSADDYFNSTVFSSAAVVSAYHDFRGVIQGKTLRFPMPVVPPFSVHLSVLERYLPPSSAQEYKDLFAPGRPSFLVDRMSELSPEGGSLLFIYPTRRGGSTFKSQYLGPILDPLLRQLVVVNELSADIGRYLGKLSSVSHMEDFDTMRNKLTQLCSDLSSSTSQFTISDARKGSAHLDRRTWTEWFIHQERTRMKEVLSLYWQNGRRLPAAKAASNMSTNYLLEDKEVTSAMLLGEILDGIRKRPYGEETEPRDGIELGVFVIRRSH